MAGSPGQTGAVLAVPVVMMLAAPVMAQEAPRGAVREIAVGSSGDVFFTVMDIQPRTAPKEPLNTWRWTFLAAPDSGPTPYDAMAVRVWVDCQTNTFHANYLEMYLDNELVRGGPMDVTETPEPGTNGADFMRAVCEPDANPDAKVFPSVDEAAVALEALWPTFAQSR